MRQMTIFAQRLCSMLGGAFFVGAFGFIVLATSPDANAFTFTTIDVPGATLHQLTGSTPWARSWAVT